MSPRTHKQLKEIRENSRNKILEVALDLFAHKGYHNTSVKTIAQEAGVSKGLVFNYFKTKEDLLMGIINQQMEQTEVLFEEGAKLSSPKEQLKFLLEVSFKMIVEQHEHYKLLVALSLQLEDFPKVKEIVHGKYHAMLGIMKSIMGEIGITDPMEIHLMAAMMDGVGLQYLVLHDIMPLEDIKNYLFKKYDL